MSNTTLSNEYYTIELTKVTAPNIALVYSNSCESAFEFIDDLTTQLTELNYTGIVIFDLLLVNASSTHRYFKAEWNGNIADFVRSIKQYRMDNYVINTLSKIYYKKNPHLLEYSILSTEKRNEILK